MYSILIGKRKAEALAELEEQVQLALDAMAPKDPVEEVEDQVPVEDGARQLAINTTSASGATVVEAKVTSPFTERLITQLTAAKERAVAMINTAGGLDLVSINLTGNIDQVGQQEVETEHFYVGITRVEANIS